MAAILMYHHIGDPPPDGAMKDALFVARESFARQIQWLQSHRFHFATLDEVRRACLGQAPMPRRAVVLTFDDGFLNNYDWAWPILRRHGATATFFITTGEIGRTDASGFAHMTATQIAELHAAGMTIGSHTVSHPWLGKIPLEDAQRELRDSKATLEAIIGEPVRWLCYPSGSFSTEVAETARQIGYEGACSVIRDNRVQPHQLFWMPRVMVMRDTPPQRLRYMLSGLYHHLHRRKNRKRWGEWV